MYVLCMYVCIYVYIYYTYMFLPCIAPIKIRVCFVCAILYIFVFYLEDPEEDPAISLNTSLDSCMLTLIYLCVCVYIYCHHKCIDLFCMCKRMFIDIFLRSTLKILKRTTS